MHSSSHATNCRSSHDRSKHDSTPLPLHVRSPSFTHSTQTRELVDRRCCGEDCGAKGQATLTDTHVEAPVPELAVLLAQSTGLTAAMDEAVGNRTLLQVVLSSHSGTVEAGVQARHAGEAEQPVHRPTRYTSCARREQSSINVFILSRFFFV